MPVSKESLERKTCSDLIGTQNKTRDSNSPTTSQLYCMPTLVPSYTVEPWHTCGYNKMLIPNDLLKVILGSGLNESGSLVVSLHLLLFSSIWYMLCTPNVPNSVHFKVMWEIEHALCACTERQSRALAKRLSTIQAHKPCSISLVPQ